MVLPDGSKLDCTVYAWRWHFINTGRSRKSTGADLPKLLPGMRKGTLNKDVCRQQWEENKLFLACTLPVIILVSLNLPLWVNRVSFLLLKPKLCTHYKCVMPRRGICVATQDNFLNSRLDFPGITGRSVERGEWHTPSQDETQWVPPGLGCILAGCCQTEGLVGRSTTMATCGHLDGFNHDPVSRSLNDSKTSSLIYKVRIITTHRIVRIQWGDTCEIAF